MAADGIKNSPEVVHSVLAIFGNTFFGVINWEARPASSLKCVKASPESLLNAFGHLPRCLEEMLKVKTNALLEEKPDRSPFWGEEVSFREEFFVCRRES